MLETDIDFRISAMCWLGVVGLARGIRLDMEALRTGLFGNEAGASSSSESMRSKEFDSSNVAERFLTIGLSSHTEVDCLCSTAVACENSTHDRD